MRYRVIVLSFLVLVTVLASAAVGTELAADLGAQEDPAPDLVLTIIRHCWYCTPPGGGTFWFCWGNYFHCIEVIVSNKGDAASGPSHCLLTLKIDLTILGQEEWKGVHAFRFMLHVPALMPGVEHSIGTKLWHPGPNTCVPVELPWNRVIGEIDPYNRVPEKDEENNTYTTELAGPECPCDYCPWEAL